MHNANWNNGVRAGPRSVNVNNTPWNVNSNNGARLLCDSSFITHIKEVAFKLRFMVSGVLKGIIRSVILPQKGKVSWQRPCGDVVIFGGCL